MEEAIKLARRFAQNYMNGINYSPLFAINDLTLLNNITIDNWGFRVDKFSGMLTYDEDEDEYTIVVNKNHITKRRLFTIAHELGHFYLHRDFQNDFYCNDMFKENYPTLEREANAFAAELLMPKNIVLYYLSSNWTLSAIAQKLGVSYEAMKWRYVNLCEMHMEDFTPEKKKQLIKMLFDESNHNGRKIIL